MKKSVKRMSLFIPLGIVIIGITFFAFTPSECDYNTKWHPAANECECIGLALEADPAPICYGIYSGD